MSVTHDYHVHSNYSDGSVMPGMVRAAADAGLEAVGFADHCNVADRERMQRAKREYGFNLDRTYPIRRKAIETLRERFDLTVYDAVELDYDPRDEDDIAAFLDEADFDYALGSVHRVGGENVQNGARFADRSEAERRAVVDEYYESLVELAESELFEIASHIDLVERTPELRGYTTPDHREMVADAFARSPTVPELNAGRALSDYGEFHPDPDLFDALRERGVGFAVGSDAHSPAELRDRIPAIRERFEAANAEPVRLFED